MAGKDVLVELLFKESMDVLTCNRVELLVSEVIFDSDGRISSKNDIET